MRLFGRILILTLVFTGYASTFARADADQPKKIVYVRAPDDRAPWPVQDIYSVNADGTEDRALTNDGHSYSPALSPDGRTILFQHDTSLRTPPPYKEIAGFESHHPTELYVMNADGSDPHLLIHAERGVSNASWSRDGKAITATLCPETPADAKCGVFVLPADGGGLGRLIISDALYGRWSPDGTKLAFSVRSGDGHSEISVANPDGSDKTSLIKNAAAYKYAVFEGWSPDSKRTVYSVAVEGGNFEIYAANADGSDPVRLIDPEAYPSAVDGAWSPDGKKIAFSAFAKHLRSGAPTNQGLDDFITREQIFLVNPDGSGLQQFTTDPEWGCVSPAWSPDGKRLTFFCRAASAPCAAGHTGPPNAGSRGCLRRIFVTSSGDPVSKLTPIIEHDGAGPKFIPE